MGPVSPEVLVGIVLFYLLGAAMAWAMLYASGRRNAEERRNADDDMETASHPYDW